MLELNLVDPSKGEMPYRISKFPDGQQAITIFPDESKLKRGVTIKSRMNSFKDVELIVCANQAIKEIAIEKGIIIPVHLYSPYHLGARSDRKFVQGSSNYLKTVICPIINSQKFASVTVMDAHSDVLEACLDNVIKIDNVRLVKFALEQIGEHDVTLVSPDAGALKKVYHVAENIKYNDEIIIASKHRDIATGNILETRVPGIDTEPGQKNYLIIDDICDGGRTFIELSKAILNIRPKSIFNTKIYLIITHGIFSAGFRNLSPYFDGIYCTNSIKDVPSSLLEEYIGPDGTTKSEIVTTKVKQLNLF